MKPSVPKPVGMPRPLKVAAPKIAHIAISPLKNGLKVQHYMTHGPHPAPFVFADPKKMTQHLARIQGSQWRSPDRNEARPITRDLDLGPTV